MGGSRAGRWAVASRRWAAARGGTWFAVTAVVVLTASLLSSSVAGAAPGRTKRPKAPATQLLATYHGSLARTGYSPDERFLDPSNVGSLAIRVAMTEPGAVSDQPAVVGGVAYFGDWSGAFHAASLDTGDDIWSTELGITTAAGCNPDTAGIGSSPTIGTVNGRRVVVTGTGAASVAELDAATGKVLWNRRLGTPNQAFVWDSPAMWHGRVYIGISSFGDCPIVPGKLVMLNAATGAVLRSFSVTPAGCAGGGIWSSPAIDTSTGSIYVTTGNAGCVTPLQDAMLELDARTLRLEGSWQLPADPNVSDDDFGATPVLFSAEIGGRIVRLVGADAKDGNFYALRRGALTAGPVWQYSVASGGDCPQCDQGAIAPAAFDGTTLYVAGGQTSISGQTCAGSVQALDPATGQPLWQACVTDGPVLGPLSEVPGLVFVTSGDRIEALSASSGAELFDYGEQDYGRFYGGVTVADDAVSVGNMDHTFLVFRLPAAT